MYGQLLLFQMEVSTGPSDLMRQSTLLMATQSVTLLIFNIGLNSLYTLDHETLRWERLTEVSLGLKVVLIASPFNCEYMKIVL